MDYETTNGSQFSLRETWSKNNDEFLGTLITAYVDGIAYTGKSPQRMSDMDDVDVLQYLEAVPDENIFPLIPEGYTVAPPVDDMSEYYLKAPQFSYEDRIPGNDFVAKCLLNEAKVLETLRKNAHPSLVKYYGCVVKNGRITHLCLKRCRGSLVTYDRDVDLSELQKQTLLEQIRDGVKHLHSLGLAHNDINPENICIDADGHAVIIDFDSCLPFGEPLVKGAAAAQKGQLPISDPENDIKGLESIRGLLLRSKPDMCDQAEGGRHDT